MSMSNPNTLVGLVPQSPPVDLTQPYDPAWLQGKTIVITGGASGFGAGFFRKWASHGANIIIGDCNDVAGRELVEEVRKSTGNPDHHFLRVDVADWQSQVDFFRAAGKLSTHGGIDAIVANAGIKDSNMTFLEPQIEAEEPKKPNFKCLDVNLVGAMYTAHLAMHYLPRNADSMDPDPNSVPGEQRRDRHLLLLGSIASVQPVPGQLIYAIAKHGVMGMFRTLRIVAKGVRVNILCPYFIDTPIVTTIGRILLAGGGMGKLEDVIDAGTRLMADSRIAGRGLMIGPRVKVHAGNDFEVVENGDDKETAVWEVFADDFEETDIFVRRFVGLTNQVAAIRGWVGWAKDICSMIYGSWMGTLRRVWSVA